MSQISVFRATATWRQADAELEKEQPGGNSAAAKFLTMVLVFKPISAFCNELFSVLIAY